MSWPRFLIRPTSLLDAIAKMNIGVIDRFFGNFLRKEGRTSSEFDITGSGLLHEGTASDPGVGYVIPFEIRLFLLRGDKRSRLRKTVVGLKLPVDLDEIRQVVCRRVDPASLLQGAMHGVEKQRAEYPVIVMSLFRPGVREEDVVGRNEFGRDQVPYGVVGLHPKQPDISKLPPFDLSANLSDPAQHPFDAEEVRIPVLGRAGQKEATLARAEIDFDGVIVTECLSKWDRM